MLRGSIAWKIGRANNMNMYKELIIWQESVKLIKEIYLISEKLPKSKEYNIKLQLKKAVPPIALNIAEGKNRKTAKDFANFLTTAIASLFEIKAILTICEELGFIKAKGDLKEKISILGNKINFLKSKLLRSDI